MSGRLLAISDLHVGYPQNRDLADGLRPEDPDDWLIEAGDVGERFTDIGYVLATLAGRFARVIWTPGNHELWTHPGDPVRLRGVARYEALVTACRRFGVVTPEDPFPVWPGPGGPVTIAPVSRAQRPMRSASIGLRVWRSTTRAVRPRWPRVSRARSAS